MKFFRINLKIFFSILLFFSFIWVGGYFLFKLNLKYFENLTLSRFLETQETLFNSVIFSTKDLISVYFEKIIYDPKIIEILKQSKKHENIARQKLYQYLFPTYKYLNEKLGTMELHFHTSDCKSFLRFYEPTQFGDDLSKVRPDVVYVKNTKHSVYGFIGGRVLFGFRYTFPIITSEGTYLGSVDITKPLDFFLSIFQNIDPYSSYKIIIKQESLPEKIQKGKHSYLLIKPLNNWVEWDQSFLGKNFYKFSNIYKKLFLNSDFKKILNISVSQVFLYKDKEGFYKVSLLPLKDFQGELKGYLVVLNKAEEIERAYKSFYQNLILFSSLLVILFILSIFLISKVQEIALERKKLKTLISFMEGGVYFINSKGNIVLINKKMSDLLGYSEDELLGKIDHEIFHILEEKTCPICECAKSEKKLEGEALFKKKNGETIFVNIFASSIKENQKILGAIVNFYDITQRKILEQKLYIEAFTDGLTTLYNRRFIEEILSTERDKAILYGEPFSIIFLDLDDFKKINDTYGHEVGDKVLKEIAKILKENLRATDILGRWGGEEFIIILKNTKLKDAINLAEILRKKISEYNIDKILVTASFGVTEYFPREEIMKTLKRVDLALYKAKMAGKNCVKYET